MQGHFTTEIGRMRTQEAIARADRYRLTLRRSRQEEPPHGLPGRTVLGRKALQALALSILLLVLGATAAVARPADVGPAAGRGGVVTGREVRPTLDAVPADLGLEIVGAVAFAALVITVAVALMHRRLSAPVN
jgi:hypothetical protein